MKNYKKWRIDYNLENHSATLTLNRPERMNVFDLESLDELTDITNQLNQDSNVWVVIVTGEGNHFSAGMDTDILQKITDVSEGVFRTNMRQMQECYDNFEKLQKPTIAKIKGFCMGAGLMFSLCCDFRIASSKSVFSMPLVKLGLTVLMGTARITRLTGISRAKEIIYFADKFNSQKAFEYGLLTRIVDGDQLDDTVAKMAEKFTKLAPKTIGITKQVINQGAIMPIRQSEDIEIDLQSSILDSSDLREAMASFIENRKPTFSGH
ncbi:MAG: enoyl-CoA hydratase/isomerase family protein [Leptonema sp. (in: Bacteria)]|nr:enoyl-CoA hydratase/isomerase family protein [Leptonema sp. (in: bacteria)]